MTRVDLLVHAAGVLGGTYARKQTFEQWRNHHVRQPRLLLCGGAGSAAADVVRVPASYSSPHRRTTNLMPGRTAYSASKAGMNAFARALALEVDRDGINVNIVTPGPVETEMLQDVPFEMHAITAADVADTVAWLDTVQTSVDLPEIRLNAVTRGPSAREPVMPLEAERRATKSANPT